MASQPISVFFEDRCPPPPLHLLTSQTDFSPFVHPSRNILSVRSSTPRLKVTKTRFASLPVSDDDNDSTVSETSVSSQLTDISDDSSVAESEEELIPKPAGEAGRPGRGGYRLSDKVELDTELFKRIRKYVHVLIGKHLNTSMSYGFQDESMRQAVRNSAMDAFPELKKYEGCWVVNDFMLLHLKNTARRGRMAAEKLLAAKGASEDKKIKKSKRSSK